MANNEAACEAVARAMELNLAIAATFETSDSAIPAPHSPLAQPSRKTGALVSAVAATAVAAAGVALMIGPGSSINGIARKDGADRIVAAWASGEAARNDADDDESLDANHDDDLDPPDWMLAALTAEDVKDQLPNTDDVREN